MRASDIARQVTVIVATCAMILAAMVGAGLFGGTSVQDLQGGALDADATVLAPARPAFSIWTVIYLGLIAYAIWQALPGQRTSPRQRAVGWWVAVTCLLNGLWLLLAQFSTLPWTVVGIVLLLVALCTLFRIVVLGRVGDEGIIDAALIDGVTGLHLGWVALATVANTTAWLTVIAPEEWGAQSDLIGCLVLTVVALIGLALAWASHWRLAPALAMAWGLSWIAVGRLTGEPASIPIGVAAIVAASIILLPTLVLAAARLVSPATE
ncbi:tryptophan-rich sensory protein [Microbacterium terricola]|uniref:Tryptophan-rich sensory protein n=1 Tax=Microbacterium terricola TaxID=344163 RepID=A0ABM8DVV3_9MICO|nr:tryptophan-rich sensory protein [Microbacterium terricola]UYK39619.1 tryptophan-rich sensory protein [Microbacterium terricola]BDV29640.1 tryptophan-rich sensory protein [Microbacterium terricola]